MRGGPILPVILVGMTPLLVFTLIILGIAFGPVRWEPPSLWSTEFGSQGLGATNRITAVSVDESGLYAGGYVGLPTSALNVTPSQLFVNRYDLSHNLVWSEGFGNPRGSRITGVAAASDGVYVEGHLNSSAFLRKYGVQGNLAWAVNLTDLSSIGSDVMSVAIGGNRVYAITSYLPTGVSNMVGLRAFDSDGNPQWNSTIGTFLPTLVSVSTSAYGVYVSGFPAKYSSGFVQAWDLAGRLMWNDSLSGYWPSGVSTDATGIYVAGQKSDLINGFIAKYDWDGKQLWIHNFRPPDRGVSYVHLSSDSSGVYIAMVTTVGSYLTKFDGNGNSQWMFRIASSPYAVSVGQSSVYVGGEDGGNENAFLAEYAQSSSLIFFGLNPPLSLLTVGLLVAAAVISLLWLRKRSKNKIAIMRRM